MLAQERKKAKKKKKALEHSTSSNYRFVSATDNLQVKTSRQPTRYRNEVIAKFLSTHRVLINHSTVSNAQIIQIIFCFLPRRSQIEKFRKWKFQFCLQFRVCCLHFISFSCERRNCEKKKQKQETCSMTTKIALTTFFLTVGKFAPSRTLFH